MRTACSCHVEWGRLIEPDDDEPALSGRLVRGARGLLGWSRADLASEAGLSLSTLKRIEGNPGHVVRTRNSRAIREALRRGGVSTRTVDGEEWVSWSERRAEAHRRAASVAG